MVVTEDSIKNGYEVDGEKIKRNLEIGKEYTVKETIVHDWSTTVYLKEFPNKGFNSVNFENVE